MTNYPDRRATAEAEALEAALQAATDMMSRRKALVIAQEARVQAEYDRYLERSMLWQTQPGPQTSLPMAYKEPDQCFDFAADDPLPARSSVNWIAVTAVATALAILPWLAPLIVVSAASAVSVVIAGAVYVVGVCIAILAVRLAFSVGKEAPSTFTASEKRGINVTVRVELDQ